MSQVVRVLVGNVKTFVQPRIINTTRYYSTARKWKYSFCISLFIPLQMKIWSKIRDGRRREEERAEAKYFRPWSSIIVDSQIYLPVIHSIRFSQFSFIISRSVFVAVVVAFAIEFVKCVRVITTRQQIWWMPAACVVVVDSLFSTFSVHAKHRHTQHKTFVVFRLPLIPFTSQFKLR